MSAIQDIPSPLAESEPHNLWKVDEDRDQIRPTIFTSADAIWNRLLHNAHRIDM
jgi:hypothetical protein